MNLMVYVILMAVVGAGSAAGPLPRNVNDFKFASQNTQGGKKGSTWEMIPNIMRSNEIDVFAIQECGTEPPIAKPDLKKVKDDITLTPIDESNFRPTFYFGLPPPKAKRPPQSQPPKNVALSINELTFVADKVQYYVYLMDNTLRLTPRLTNPRTTQNMVIISRYQASKIFVLPMIDKDKKLVTDDNVRPVFGIQIDNAVFFNIHSRSDGGEKSSNEAAASVNVITAHMIYSFPELTWIIMGDFNRLPHLVESELDKLPGGYTRAILKTGQPTHAKLEIDYAVIGGDSKLLSKLPQVELLVTPPDFKSDHKGIAKKIVKQRTTRGRTRM